MIHTRQITNERPPSRAGGTVQTAVEVRRTDPLREPSDGSNEHLFAFYGTLMTSAYSEAGVSFARGENLGRSLGPCQIPGTLYAVNAGFPALMEGTGIVHGELWECKPEHLQLATEKLDTIESYRHWREHDSMYLRRRVRLIEPDVEAWVYVWNFGLRGLEPIPTGRWESGAPWRYTDLED